MFFPNFTQPQQIIEAYKKMVEAHVARLGAVNKQLVEQQELGASRAQEAIDESAKLMKDGLAYSQQLSAEWRKLMLDSARQSMTMMMGV